MSKYRQFHRLPRPQKWLLFQAMFLIPFIAVSLRLFGFRRTQAFLTWWLPDHAKPDASTPLPASTLAYLVYIAASRGLYRATCLEHSLALWWFLRRRHLPAALKIGVRKAASRLEAHAWVELDGQILNDTADITTDFAPFHESVDVTKAHLT